MLHSFVGFAATILGFSSHLRNDLMLSVTCTNKVETVLGVFIGSVTFTGSIVAFLKLQGTINGKPLTLPGRHMINLVLLSACLVFGGLFVAAEHIFLLAVVSGVAGVLGAHMVMAIGGADMPVVVSMLNSYSGWATSASGFMIDNYVLIVSGALIGSSGAILSYIMCKAMNRSFLSVILGGLLNSGGASQQYVATGDMKEISNAEMTALALSAKKVMIVPGYGMASA